MLNKFTFLLSSSQIVSEFQFLMQRHTVRNLHHFVQKFNFDFPKNFLIFFGWKTRENFEVLDFLAVDNFDFTIKFVKTFFVKTSWKCWSFVKIEFLDKNLTFRIVCKKTRTLCLENQQKNVSNINIRIYTFGAKIETNEIFWVNKQLKTRIFQGKNIFIFTFS